MPYIPPDTRGWLEDCLSLLRDNVDPLTTGELNYVLTSILLMQHPSSYSDFNALLGVLEAVKLEMYRRMIAPYEDTKRFLNGDVYP